MLWKKVTILLCLSYGTLGRLIKDDDPNDLEVTIRNGKIKGRKHETEELERNFYAFRGIPFAEKPIGNLRFAAPVPIKDWQGTIETINDASSCVQGSNPVVGTEDCLYLNVYTPQFPTSSDDLVPVMVWVYGGGFQAGSSNYSEYGPDYFLDKNVILVSINYRLGILGFMSTGDLVSPGNNGLKDQVLALKWVKDNIRTFGGDPEKVTVFGQSAGSASVSYLLQSKLTKGLFQRAILESGVSLSGWAFSRHNTEMSFTVGKDLKIFTNSSQVLVDSLRKIDYVLLQVTTSAALSFKLLSTSLREGFVFSPVIEPEHPGAFQTEKSHTLLSTGNFNKVPVIIGYNSLEGTFGISLLLRVIFAKWDAVPSTLVPASMNVKADDKRSEIGRKIHARYFEPVPAILSDVNIMKFLGDDLFVRPVAEIVGLISKYAPVYFYRFAYEGNLWGITNRTAGGVTHSEELGYLFKSKFEDRATHIDTLVRSRMVKLWTNFAKFGHPTPKKDSLFENTIWHEARVLSEPELSYMDITDHLEIKKNPDSEAAQFWKDLFQTYAEGPYDTY